MGNGVAMTFSNFRLVSCGFLHCQVAFGDPAFHVRCEDERKDTTTSAQGCAAALRQPFTLS